MGTSTKRRCSARTCATSSRHVFRASEGARHQEVPFPVFGVPNYFWLYGYRIISIRIRYDQRFVQSRVQRGTGSASPAKRRRRPQECRRACGGSGQRLASKRSNIISLLDAPLAKESPNYLLRHPEYYRSEIRDWSGAGRVAVTKGSESEFWFVCSKSRRSYDGHVVWFPHHNHETC